MNHIFASIISLFMAAVHFEHGIMTPIALAIVYAVTPKIKYNREIAVGVYSLTYLYRYDSILLLSFVELIKGVVVINYVRQNKCYSFMNFMGVLGISGLAFKWHYKHILLLLLYTFGLGVSMWLSMILESALLFYVSIYLYQFVLYGI